MPTDVINDSDRDDTSTDATVQADPAATEALVDDELLVEEVSIDGMCGVY
jgi:mycofactocin precursor